jgi:hypothetical protein
MTYTTEEGKQVQEFEIGDIVYWQATEWLDAREYYLVLEINDAIIKSYCILTGKYTTWRKSNMHTFCVKAA